MDTTHLPPAAGAPAPDAFDGSPTWKVVRTLRDGTAITIRPITPDDREELRRAFRETSATTRYLRFMGVVGELSESMLTYLTEVDQKNHIALVATITSPDLKTERGVGVARVIRLEGEPHVAEAAITVADDMQKRGIGSALAIELEHAARRAGIHTIRAEVLEGNAAMRAILEMAGAHRVASRNGSGTLSYNFSIEPVHPTRIVDVLRGAAQTMAMSLLKLLPPPHAHEKGPDKGPH